MLCTFKQNSSEWIIFIIFSLVFLNNMRELKISCEISQWTSSTMRKCIFGFSCEGENVSCEITMLIVPCRDEDKCEKRGLRKHFGHLKSFTCSDCKHWFLNYQSESSTRLKIAQFSSSNVRRNSQTLHCVFVLVFVSFSEGRYSTKHFANILTNSNEI